jgi:peptidoglycan/xylan/chitin deacetylase (PgdA/CDA1 family)
MPRVLQPSGAAAVILRYQRVAVLDTDPQCLAVPPDRFDDHLDLLNRNYHILPLTDRLRGLSSNTLPHHSLAITFEPGYADTLLHAKPLLEEHATPATVFVTTGPLARPEEFFWDQLDRLLLQPGRLPRHLNLAPPRDDEPLASPMTCDLGLDDPWTWTLSDEHADYTPARAATHRHWNVFSPDTPTPRHAAGRALYPALANSDPLTRARWLETLRSRFNLPADPRDSHRMRTPDELRQLASCDLIDIGAHTVTYPRLATLSIDDQRHEIAQSKRTLEDLLARPVRSFASPFGHPADYTPKTLCLVREAGFDHACSSVAGPVGPGFDPYQLPRVPVHNCSPDHLDRHLRHALLD